MYEMILSLLIQFGVQTVFLLVALWVMIKLQGLNYNFPGLLGAAALASILDRGLELAVGHFLGIYFASYLTTPIVVTVLFICLTKVTHADRTDVFFTIGVGYALWFVINLWCLGALMGDLRLSARENPALARENSAVSRTNNPALKTDTMAAEPDALQPAEAIARQFAIKGVTRNGGNSSVTIQSGKKIYSVFLNDETLVQTDNGLASVRLTGMGETSLTLEIGGAPVKLPLP